MDEQLLLSVPQMARRLSIGKTQAWAIVARREVPVVKIGRSTRVLKGAVDDWARARAAGSSSSGRVRAGPVILTGMTEEWAVCEPNAPVESARMRPSKKRTDHAAADVTAA